MLYFTGDCHGNIVNRFSYKNYPELRELTKDDTVFVLGDFGVPWFNFNLKFYDYGIRPESYREEHYKLNFLNNKPGKTVVIAGNHENYDLIEEMPKVFFNHSFIRQMKYQGIVYKNIYYIDSPQYMCIENQELLLIPGAESHDVDYLFELNDPELKTYLKTIRKKEQQGETIYYRINHFSGGEKEKVDSFSANLLAEEYPSIDYILTHDCPGALKYQGKKPGTPARIPPTESELALQNVYDKVSFKMGIHAHYHNYIEAPNLYTLGLPCNGFGSLDDINNIKKRYDAENECCKKLIHD